MTQPTTTLSFLTDAPRHLFFTGKGGVGKTSLACASALALADAGKRVLLVSTDDEIREAIAVGHMVEKGAMSAMRQFSNTVLEKNDSAPAGGCCGPAERAAGCCG